jgi:PleD family two-component response regulator
MGTRITAKLSLGVAVLSSGEQPAALYRRVDEKLYAAKRGGRNRVMA